MEPLRDRGLRWLQDVARDVSYGLRTLRRSPGFTATALLSLGLGIGANTGIFSLVNQVLLRELRGVREPERLVILGWSGRDLATSFGSEPLMSYPVCRDLQTQKQFFDGVFCRHPTTVLLSTGKQHAIVDAELVSGAYFGVLGIQPALGRLIDVSDDREPGAHPVAVLSYDYWQSALGSAQDVVGTRILINNHPMTVIGVAPASFRGVDLGAIPAVWLPATMKRQATPEWDRLFDRRAAWMHVFGRLAPGVSAGQAKAGLQGWFKSMVEADAAQADFSRVPPEQLRQFFASTLDVRPAARGRSDLRDTLTRPLWVLMGGTVLLLLLTASNVAGLLLARGAARTRELTTRMALGATRGRVTRQLLVETLLITLGGGTLGIVAAPAVSQLLLSFVERDVDLSARIDPGVFLFALLVCIVTGGVCGLAPVFQIRRLPLGERAQIRAVGGVRFRKALVIGQIAFTLILLTSAGLFVQTVSRLQAKAPAAASRVIMFGADPQRVGYPDPRARQFMRDLHRKLQTLAGVERVAEANASLLTGGSFSRGLTIQADRQFVTDRNAFGLRVSPGFFAMLGTRIIDGREFDERDTRLAGDTAEYRSVIVNESFARRYFGGRSPVGARLGIGIQPGTPTTIDIIGLVEDISYRSLRLTESEHIFFPFWEQGSEKGTVYVRVHGEPHAAFAPIRAAVAELDSALPLTALTTFDDQIDRSLTNERMLATLSSGFGAVALLISLVGLYGVMAFIAAQRTQEIGVRLALGATRGSAVWLVARDAVTMVGAGILVAVPVGWALGRIVEAQLFGVRPFDGPTIAIASGGLAMVALAAASLPAWRAAMLPPMVAIGDQPESMWQTARLRVRRALRELAAGGDREPMPSVTFISELTARLHGSESFADALQVGLTALRERAGAQSIMLLEKVSNDVYRSGDLSIPARGLLVQRLTHYPHPLPLTAGQIESWLRWARELRPEHVTEIERLRDSGARIAVALRIKREIAGVLLLGPSERHEHFTEPEKQLLSSSAEVFALMIENARLTERALEQEQVRRDLALASEVQRRLLPPRPPACAAATLAAFTLPARTVGGDYYDFLELGGERIGIAVADIAGKGIAAALLMSVVQASLRVISADTDVASAELATKLNRFLYQSTAMNHYATFFYAQFDGPGRRLRYVNAGHNPPHLLRRTAHGVEIADLSVGGTVIGLFPDAAYEEAEVELQPGDLLVAFTDGIPEALNASGEEFGEERLKDLLRGVVGAPAEEVAAVLAAQMRAWIVGTEQHDDLTFVVAAVNNARPVTGSAADMIRS